jgi:hypothetical protein
MKILKQILFVICAIFAFAGISYRFILPFTSAEFDFVIWGVIGLSVVGLVLLGRSKK